MKVDLHDLVQVACTVLCTYLHNLVHPVPFFSSLSYLSTIRDVSGMVVVALCQASTVRAIRP